MITVIEKYFLWIMIYSIIGWIYESILCSADQKKFINRGFLNGPYCPVYGFGAVVDIIVMGRIDNPFLLFLFGALLTCILEYLTSFAMEAIFHARWWDYSDRKFNINGRVCLLGAVVFGLFSMVLIKFIHPLVSELTGRISALAMHISVSVLAVAFISDIIVTVTGFTGFNEKLREIALMLEQKKTEVIKNADSYKSTAAEKLHEIASKRPHPFNEIFTGKLNAQQRRMIKSFPKLKSVKYNNILTEIRNAVQNAKKNIKKTH